MTDDTSKTDFNQSGANRKNLPKRNYTHKQVIQKTNTMARLAKTAEQQKDMLALKDRYLKRKDHISRMRPFRDANLLMGMRAGIHQGDVFKWQQQEDKVADQYARNRTMKKANALYRNYSLSKTFNNHAPPKGKNKDKEMDKG